MSKRKQSNAMLNLVSDEQQFTDEDLEKALFEKNGRAATEAELIALRVELKDTRADNLKRVKLVEFKGATSVYIDAEILDTGELLISGQDIGSAPEELFGGSEYEYWVRLSASNKDRLLLALLKKNYFGKLNLISELQDLMKAKGIDSEFSSYS